MPATPSFRARFALFLTLAIAITQASFGEGRVQVAEGRQGMVVSGHPQATAAGVEILRAGGNAIDAAVAVSLALGVAEPYGSGLGGKLMLLYHDAKTGRTHCIEALDKASDTLDVDAYRKLPAADRAAGVHSICVPGLPAGIMLAHATWGRLPRADVTAPAVKLAREGFDVLPGTVTFFKAQEGKLRANPELARIYLPGGELPEPGMKLANEDLARTLEGIANSGADGFYKGGVAAAIVAESKRLGGPFTADDFTGYLARPGEPLGSTFGSATIITSPPPATGGAMLALTLRVLENHLPDSPALRTPETMDRVLRTYREVNNVVWQQIADTEDSGARFAALGSDESIAALRAAAFGTAAAPAGTPAISMTEATLQEALSASTTHFVVVDREGNVVSATQSLSHHFGSGIVAPGTGVVLNNSMSNFSVFTRENPNVVAPGKRPRSTITPTLVLREGRPTAVAGIPGAARIPTAMIQTLLDVLFFGRTFAESIADTRWHLVTSGGSDSAQNLVHFEAGADPALLEGLRAHGWNAQIREEPEYFGGINAIEIREDGALVGVADQRRTNSAAGF